MRRPGGTSMLGVALGERECAVAEVVGSRAGGAATVVRVGAMTYPTGVGVEQAQVLGETLKKFLKESGFGGGKAVVGLPARWLTARERVVPPAQREVAGAMLRLQAERAFPPELKDLVFDYAGETDAAEQRTVLLLAAERSRVDRGTEIARAAGLTAVAVTPSALALSAVTGARTLVSLSGESAELVVRSAEGGPRVLRHVGVAAGQLLGTNGVVAPGLAALGSELFRTVAVTGTGVGGNGEVSLFDGVGLEDEAVAALSKRAGLAVSRARGLVQLDLSGDGTTTGEGSARYGAAAALALVGLRPERMPADFLHTKLAPPKERKVGRKLIWGVTAALALLLIVGYPVYDIYSTQAQIDGIAADIDAKKEQITAAEQLAAKVKVAQGWYDNKPPVLDCLKHVSQAFPQEGSVWATGFTLKENGKGTLTGKATDRRAIFGVRDSMMKDQRFADVQLSETHEGNAGAGPAASRDRDTTFAIAFTFKDGVTK